MFSKQASNSRLEWGRVEPDPPLVKGWQCPPKNPSQRGILPTAALGQPSKKQILKSFISGWAAQYSTRRTGFYQLTFSKEFLFHSSFHMKDVFPINPALDLFFLWTSQLNTTSSISAQTLKWNDFAAIRTKFPLIPDKPSHEWKFKKSLTTGTRWLSTTWDWWVIKSSSA